MQGAKLGTILISSSIVSGLSLKSIKVINERVYRTDRFNSMGLKIMLLSKIVGWQVTPYTFGVRKASNHIRVLRN